METFQRQTMALLGMNGMLSDGPPRLLFLEEQADEQLANIRTRFGAPRPFMVLWGRAESSSDDVRRLLRQFGLNGVATPAADGRSINFATPEGGTLHFTEPELFAAFLRRRAAVRWFATTADSALTLPSASDEFRLAAGLLATAQQSGLLCDRNGNVAVRSAASRAGWCGLLVSPRGVDKSTLAPSELCSVEVAPELLAVRCERLSHKSSIDAGVLGTLLHHRPHVAAMLHFHHGHAIVLPNAVTGFPYPCGTMEEADELLRVVRAEGESQLIEMIEHGYLMAMSRSGAELFLEQWRLSRDEHRAHLVAIGEENILMHARQHPILVDGRVIGIFLVHARGWGSIYVRTCERGRGRATALAAEVARRGMEIAVDEKCGVLRFYLRLGWSLVRTEGETSFLQAPRR